MIDFETLPGDEPDLSNAKLYADSNRGIYIPKYFADSVDRACLSGVSTETLAELSDPDNEGYWDAWARVLDDAVLCDHDGTHYRLWQDGDLWLIPSPTDAKLKRLVGEPLTKAQRAALKSVYDRGPIFNAAADKLLAAAGWTFDYTQEPVSWTWTHRVHGEWPRAQAWALVERFAYARRKTYREFRRLALRPMRRGDPVMVPWCGMWLGIESDGYTHS